MWVCNMGCVTFGEHGTSCKIRTSWATNLQAVTSNSRWCQRAWKRLQQATSSPGHARCADSQVCHPLASPTLIFDMAVRTCCLYRCATGIDVIRAEVQRWRAVAAVALARCQQQHYPQNASDVLGAGECNHTQTVLIAEMGKSPVGIASDGSAMVAAAF